MPVRTPLWLTNSVQSGTPGTKASWTIRVDTGTTVGQTLTFAYGAGQFNFTAVANVPGTLLPNTFRGAPDPWWGAENLAAGLQANYFINRDYVVTYAGRLVTLTQRDLAAPGSDTPNTWYNVTEGFTSDDWGAVDTYALGVNGAQLSNHALRATVYIEQPNGSFTRLPDRSCSVVDGIVPAIQLDPVLLPHLLNDLAPGALDYRTPYTALYGQSAKGAFRRFYVETTEFYGNPAVPRAVERKGSPTEPLTAWLAGFQQQDAEAATNFISNLQYATNLRPWLTWRGRSAAHEVSRNQRHYLTHYAWADIPTDGPRLQVQVTCADGTVTPWTIRYYSNPPYQRRTLSIWATGYDHLYLDQFVPSTTTAVTYAVRLIGPDGMVLSEERSFTLVEEDYQEIQLLYLNSLGGYDPLRATGSWGEEIDPQWQATVRPAIMADHLQATVARSAAVPQGGQRTLTLETGHLPLSEHRCVLDILGSPDIRVVDHARRRYMPARIVKSKAMLMEQRGDSDEHLYAMHLELLVGDVEDVKSQPFPFPVIVPPPDPDPETV